MKKYRVIYQARNDCFWHIWEDNIPTYEEAERARLQAIEIFCTYARIQEYNCVNNF